MKESPSKELNFNLALSLLKDNKFPNKASFLYLFVSLFEEYIKKDKLLELLISPKFFTFLILVLFNFFESFEIKLLFESDIVFIVFSLKFNILFVFL